MALAPLKVSGGLELESFLYSDFRLKRAEQNLCDEGGCDHVDVGCRTDGLTDPVVTVNPLQVLNSPQGSGPAPSVSCRLLGFPRYASRQGESNAPGKTSDRDGCGWL